MVWRFIDTGFNDGYYNMAVDEAILISNSKGQSPPTIRFYGWSPAAISIGYFQRMEKEVDIEVCKNLGIDYVRRLTGGRAVLHDMELTYSLVAPEREEKVSGSILESYLKISRGLLKGLNYLDIKAQMVSGTESGKMGTAACFDSPSWYELVVDNKKVVGSAQTRKHGVILQHGSILLDLDIDKLFSVLKFPSNKVQERVKEQFKDKACSIKDILGKEVPYDEAARAFFEGFRDGLGIELVPGELSNEEMKLTEDLIGKYNNDEWNMRR